MYKYDYDEWRSCMESLEPHPITDIIARDRFEKFVELHHAIRSGDTEEIARLSRELIFGRKPGRFIKMKHVTP